MNRPSRCIVRWLRSDVICIVALVFTLIPSVAGRSSAPLGNGQAPQTQELEGGPRLFIAAVHDSGLFTLCPSSYSPVVRGVIQPDPDGFWVIKHQSSRASAMLVGVRQTGESARLPLPPADLPTADRSIDRFELGTDLLTGDDDVAAAVAAAVKSYGTFKLVESADNADKVLLVESHHETIASFGLPNRRDLVAARGGDREANFLMALFAALVPAEQYLKHGPDVTALLPVSLWSGATFARRAGPLPLPHPARQANSSSTEIEPASAQRLVEQLVHRERRPGSFPPSCAATAQPARGGASTPTIIGKTVTSGRAVAPRSSAAENAARGPTFSTGVTYVSVPVVVKDPKGRPVPGLTISDFRVYEDDADQNIDRLMMMSEPFDVVLLVDTSASMRGELVDLHNAVLGFIERLQPPDRLMLASFDDRVFVQAELTSERARQRQALSQAWIGRGQGTRLYDAIDLVVARRVPAMGDRRAIVLFTDGVDTRSRIADADSSRDLIAGSNVPVYVIQYDTASDDYPLPYGVKTQGLGIRDMAPRLMPEGGDDNRELFKRGDSYLSAITDLSGGRLYRTYGLRNLTAAFAEITRDLAEQYTLWYYPTNQARDGSYRKLRVEVNKPDVQVRTRSGYRAVSASPLRREP